MSEETLYKILDASKAKGKIIGKSIILDAKGFILPYRLNEVTFPIEGTLLFGFSDLDKALNYWDRLTHLFYRKNIVIYESVGERDQRVITLIPPRTVHFINFWKSPEDINIPGHLLKIPNGTTFYKWIKLLSKIDGLSETNQ